MPSCYTFTNIYNGKQTMIDIFVCSQQLHCQVHNCRITSDGVESNHSAVRLDLTMTSLKHKMSTTLTHGTINWHKIASNTATIKHYNNILLASTEMIAMSYEDFNKSIIAAGTEAALLVKSTCDNWFQFSVSDLAPIIAERNEVLNALHSAKVYHPPSLQLCVTPSNVSQNM